MKLFCIFLSFCIIYFVVAGVVAFKLAKKQQGMGVLHHDRVSEVIKESGIYNIYNINGDEVK